MQILSKSSNNQTQYSQVFLTQAPQGVDTILINALPFLVYQIENLKYQQHDWCQHIKRVCLTFL